MSDSETPDVVGEGAVSGNQASIPSSIRERANIRDGDKLRWYWADGDLAVEIVRQRNDAFEEFEGYDGRAESLDHDLTGLEPAGERDAGEPIESVEE